MAAAAASSSASLQHLLSSFPSLSLPRALHFSSSRFPVLRPPPRRRLPSRRSPRRTLSTVASASSPTAAEGNRRMEEQLKEEEPPPAMDGARAAELVAGLRRSFRSERTRSHEWRAAQISAIIRMIEENEAEILAALHDDVGKPHIESFVQEISMAKGACTFALKQLKHWMKPEKVPSSVATFPSSAEIVSEPLGLILVISAWNYPFLLSIDPVIGAIAAGNVVVLKPSELAPATSSLFAKAMPKYIDNSCIKVVEGAIPETTTLLDQKWDKIMYTGNGRVGRIVMAAAAKNLTPVLLELGGKCPVVVDSNVDLKVAAKRIVIGKWGDNNGQACIAPDYILTTQSYPSELVDALKITIEEFYGTDPLESADLSRIVNLKHFKRLINLLEDEKVTDKIVYGGQRDEKRLKIAPTILLDVPHDSQIMKEEIFGPLLPIITVDELEESFDFINSNSKPLAAYLFTKDKKLEQKFIGTVSAGGMLINDTTLHLESHYLPFGGVGESGIGSYHGKFSFDSFSHKKSVLIRSFAGEVSSRYPPYTMQKQKFLRAVLNGDFIGLILALLDGLKNRF